MFSQLVERPGAGYQDCDGAHHIHLFGAGAFGGFSLLLFLGGHFVLRTDSRSRPSTNPAHDVWSNGANLGCDPDPRILAVYGILDF
jgi:hypothetical protein